MKKVNLTPEQKVNLEAQHDKCRDKRTCDRIKAVLLRSEGWSTPMISQALRLHEATIVRHIDDFLKKNKLSTENGGSSSHLSKTQTQEVVAHLMEYTYHHAHQIAEYIWQTHQVRFSIPGLNKWLHRQGFSYKQPKGVPHKFDEEKQAEFIEQYDNNLKSEVPEDTIYFMDAVHPTQATKISCGWIKKGHDKPIKTTGSRTRINLIGAVNLSNIGAAPVKRYEKVNSESIQEFLEELRSQHKNENHLHLILDGAGYHRAKEVKTKAEELNITLHYLPPYSPNLNPIERLWKIMNQHVRGNRYFASAKEFRDKIDEFFDKTLPKIGNDLGSWINDNFQVLEHAS